MTNKEYGSSATAPAMDDLSAQLDQLAADQQRLINLILTVGLVCTGLLNMVFGHPERGAIYLVAGSVVGHQYWRLRSATRFQPVGPIKLMVYLLMLLPVFTTGGLMDPRVAITLVGFPLIGSIALGRDRLKLLTWVSAGLLVVVLVLEKIGLLELIHFTANQPEHQKVVMTAILAWFGLFSIFMWLSYHQTQTRLLSDAIERAYEAKAAESRFLSNMSHEIRNPLNGVLGLLRQAIDEDDPKHTEDQLQTALHSGERLRRILDDILNLKKLQAEEFTLEHESFDLSQDMGSIVVATARSLAKAKHVQVISETENNRLPRLVVGDATRITQIGINLVSNAVKFTPEHGVVTIRQSYDYEKEELTLEVSDTGIGMSPETIATLFQRFKQASDGTTKGFQGTGLGLAISKNLIDLMGGRITVESEPGKGSTFTVTVPLAVDQSQERARATEAAPEQRIRSDGDEKSLEAISVLCVDDSSINLKVVSRPLNKAGASVTTALSGSEALDLIRVHDFDIVLTDISMPEMDGEQLQQELKQWKIDLPVVAVTGNVLEVDVKRYLSNGFVATIAKPIDIDQLIEVVEQHALRR